MQKLIQPIALCAFFILALPVASNEFPQYKTFLQDTDGDGIPDEVDREVSVIASPACEPDAEGYVEIANKTYTSQESACVADRAITTGIAVEVADFGSVVYQAPVVRLYPGFSVTGDGHFAVQTPVSNVPEIAGCNIFPADNFWNTSVDDFPLHPDSTDYIASIGTDTNIHPDFGTTWNDNDIGISFDIIPASQSLVPIAFNYWDESDRDDKSCNPENDDTIGCYPIPVNPTIEGQPANEGDRHVLLLQQNTCMLYEIFAADKSSGSWTGGSGAIWDLSQNQVRPETWTSADASGLAILPGLLKYDEVYGEGEIEHAIRFTAGTIRRAYILPATHSDGQGGNSLLHPAMGQRFRLKADFDIAGFDPAIQKILRALKKYGMVLADTGSDMFMSGQHHDDWDNDLLRELRQVTAGDFEAVYNGDAISY